MIYLNTSPLSIWIIFFTFLLTSICDATAARLPDIYWNSTNPIFRIDNTDHIIDVNRGNVAYEYDQINIICPMYSKGTREEDIETYIIYNVSKEEYDSCHIANPAVARTIAVCDKPFLNRYYTITFRPFTPQPGGLEFRPGQDYYFIALSAKAGEQNPTRHCQKYHMKVVFKVCCKRPQQPAIASKPGAAVSSTSTTAVPPSTSTITSSTLSFNGLPNLGPHRYGVATYPGVIVNTNHVGNATGSNSASLPAMRPHTSSPPRTAQAASYSPNTSFIYKNKADSPFSNKNYSQPGMIISDVLSSHRPAGNPHYGNNYYPPTNNVVSTNRSSVQGSQMTSSRLPHAPYHPYHPSQLTSTPTPHWWRPHFTKQRHNFDSSRPADQGYAFKKSFKDRVLRPNDIREKSDGLNSGSLHHGLSLWTLTWLCLVSLAVNSVSWHRFH